MTYRLIVFPACVLLACCSAHGFSLYNAWVLVDLPFSLKPNRKLIHGWAFLLQCFSNNHLRNKAHLVRDKFGLTPADYVAKPFAPLPRDHGVRDEVGHAPVMVSTLQGATSTAYEQYREGNLESRTDDNDNNGAGSSESQSPIPIRSWESFGAREDLKLPNDGMDDESDEHSHGNGSAKMHLEKFDTLPNATTVLALLTSTYTVCVYASVYAATCCSELALPWSDGMSVLIVSIHVGLTECEFVRDYFRP